MPEPKFNLSFWVKAGLGFGLGVLPWVILWSILVVLFLERFGAQVLWEIGKSPVK